MSIATSRKSELDADLNDTAWFGGDPDLIDVAGLAANLACRLYPWPCGSMESEQQFEAIDPNHYERLVAGSRLAPMTHQLTVRAFAEGWTRRRLLATFAKLDSDYRARYTVRAH